jgi:hypothetical protein
VALHAGLLQRADVEEVADVVVDHALVTGRDGGTPPEEVGEAGQIELVGADGVRGEFPDGPAVEDESGRRVSEQHARKLSDKGSPRRPEFRIGGEAPEGHLPPFARLRG